MEMLAIFVIFYHSKCLEDLRKNKTALMKYIVPEKEVEQLGKLLRRYWATGKT